MPSSDIPGLLARIKDVNYHRPHQSESLAREIQSLEWALRGRSEHNGTPMPTFDRGDEPMNREALEESLLRTRQLYERHNPEGAPFNALEKNKLYQYMQQEVEPAIKEGNPTHEMMEEANSSNVDWWSAWHRQKKSKILEWRKIRRVLDPRNTEPNFGNVSILRTNSLNGGDPRRYWQGFEDIAFTERVEELIDTISDEQYLRCLQLKALDWSATNVCRELGWTKVTYEQAMHRLRDDLGTVKEPASETGEDEITSFPGMDAPYTSPPPRILQVPSRPGTTRFKAVKPSPQKSAVHPLNSQLEQRGIVKSAVAKICHMTPARFANCLHGAAKFRTEELIAVQDAIALFDRDPTTLPVHEPKEGS